MMDDKERSEVTLEDFQRWKVPQLRNFLADRGLKRSKLTKAELVALAYAAFHGDAPIIQSEHEEMKQRATEYRELLKVNGTYLPDPLVELTDGWQGEASGILNWPPISYFEIAEFLAIPSGVAVNKHGSLSDDMQGMALKMRMIGDYKEGKAFSYFDAEWLKEVQYNPINENSEYCVLKAECIPSERIKDPPHDVWVIANKKTGKVMSAHCGCFAGLGSTCNHVGAVLFKVDYAFMRGWTTKSCTSLPCKWNTYSGGRTRGPSQIEGTRVSDMEWRKPHFGKGGQRRSINPPKRKLFHPSKSTKKPCIEELTGALFDTMQSSCIQPYIIMEGSNNFMICDDINVDHEVECVTSATIPKSLSELATLCKTADSLITFLDSNHLSPEEVEILEECTRGQHSVPLWHEQRKGRITGSKVHRVLTRMRTVKDKPQSNVSSLICYVMGYSAPDPSLPALKYGKLQEPIARDNYIKRQQKHHKSFIFQEAGLFVNSEFPVLGASPDGLVSCSCCGDGLVEIKCPLSIVGQTPSPKNLSYLTNISGDIKLKKTHAYYTQIVMQLGVTRHHKWCDFYIFTGVESTAHCERIHFDTDLWAEITEACTFFFRKYLVHELVSPQLCPATVVSSTHTHTM